MRESERVRESVLQSVTCIYFGMWRERMRDLPGHLQCNEDTYEEVPFPVCLFFLCKLNIMLFD